MVGSGPRLFAKSETEQSIPARFEHQVARHPGRVAVQTDHETVTYGALNCDANRVALAVADLTRPSDQPIALLLESGIPMIGAMLGALKAGRMYVPLDPRLPDARLGLMLEDSLAGGIVTNRRNRALAERVGRNRCELIDVDELEPPSGAANLGVPIVAEAPAWILYTSGTTGRPKGVVQTHRNVLHFVMIYTNGLRIVADDRLSLLFSCAVNAGAHEIFTALLNGASLHLVDLRQRGVDGLAEWLVQRAISVYSSVPTVYRQFLRTLTGRERFPSLRFIKLVGEPVSRRDVELYKAHFGPECILVNRLGSTETGTIRWHFIRQDTQIEGPSVPVGYPVEDNEILLLDDTGREVAAGGVGEIAVKSHYVLPGYWRRPDLSQTALLTAPNGDRIFRTGDLGCLLPNGSLLHLGRKDGQLKIRGHRVEAAEIEMALLDLGGIRDAVVVGRADRAGDQRLVAYLVPAATPAPSASSLRRGLAERLPDHMIPSAFVKLDGLPLAPNGKVDRQALPAPRPDRPDLDTPFIGPRTPIERTVADIWAEVLGLFPIGIHDAFIELGGDSLRAFQVLARVRAAFGLELPASLLFEAPTVEHLAATVVRFLADDASGEDAHGRSVGPPADA